MTKRPHADLAPDHDTDDALEGTLLSRRRTLRLLGLGGLGVGVGGAALLAGPGADAARTLPGCVVRPARTVGPYFKEEHLQRADIRADSKTGVVQAGVPLALTFQVSRVGTGGCTPLAGLTIDVWQSNAQGVYSDIGGEHTLGQDFLRGFQLTDARGRATFRTIYPGWYPSRAVHLHFKVRQIVGAQVRSSFTSQLFFDDTLTDQVVTLPAYRRPTARKVRNATDSIYGNGGHQLELDLKGDLQTGYSALFELGMNLR